MAIVERSSLTQAFEALADPYRRALLVALSESNPQNDDDLDPLNLVVTGDADSLAVTEAELIHIHLPKLTHMGFIHWDRASGEISTGPHWETIAPILRVMDTHAEELPCDWPLGPLPEDRERYH